MLELGTRRMRRWKGNGGQQKTEVLRNRSGCAGLNAPYTVLPKKGPREPRVRFQGPLFSRTNSLSQTDGTSNKKIPPEHRPQYKPGSIRFPFSAILPPQVSRCLAAGWRLPVHQTPGRNPRKTARPHKSSPVHINTPPRLPLLESAPPFPVGRLPRPR